MLLIDVRIKNYKCILDSETFSIDQLTCLVGKNESGKSAILQALYKLSQPSQRAVKMNGLRPPLTAPPGFAVRQSRSDSKECCRPALLFREGEFP